MQTILLVPISRGIGVTSAALGLIRAFDYNGIKAGFMKPFLQDDTLDKQTAWTAQALWPCTLLVLSRQHLSAVNGLSA